MESPEKTRELIRGACARFDRDVKPSIDKGFYSIAAGDLELIIDILNPHKSQIEDLPSGINYLISLKFIYKALVSNQKPSKERMQEYKAYSAQVTMQRPD